MKKLDKTWRKHEKTWKRNSRVCSHLFSI